MTITRRLRLSDFADAGDSDDTAALLRARSYMQVNRSLHYELTLEPRLHQYDNNGFLSNVRSVAVLAAGAQLQCTFGQSDVGDTGPLVTPEAFLNHGNRRPMEATQPREYGYKFASAAVDATSVTLLTAAYADKFPAGMPVILHGFDQQNGEGYPPNSRYSMFNTVTSANIETGVLQLAEPLTWSFDQNWKEYDQWGAPRIIPLRRPYLYTSEYIEIVGPLEFLWNPNRPAVEGTNPLLITGIDVVVRKVTHYGSVWPTVFRSYLYEDCIFTAEDIQGDKVAGELEFRRCVMKRMHYGTSVNTTRFVDCTIGPFDAPIHLGSPNTIVSGCRLIPTGTAAIGFSGWPATSLVVNDVTIEHQGDLEFLVQTKEPAEYDIDDVDGQDLLLADTHDAGTLILHVAPGALAWNADFSNYGRITNITFNGTHHVISGNWPEAPQVGETWLFIATDSISVEGVTWEGPPRPVISNVSMPMMDSSTITFDSKDVPIGPFETVPHRLFGIPTRVRVDVSSAINAGSRLDVYLHYGPDEVRPIRIPLDAIGWAESTTEGTSQNSGGGATLVTIPTDIAVNLMQFLWVDVESVPEILITVEATSAFPEVE